VNGFPRFLQNKNLKAKNGKEAGLRPKGGGRMPLFPLLSAAGGEMDFATGKIQCLNPPRMAD
jgi:hypothetical protein